jgi:hypothetical protein
MYISQISITHTIEYIQYCLKIKINSFQIFLMEMAFSGNGNRTFFVFGGKGLWRKQLILFWRKRKTPFT